MQEGTPWCSQHLLKMPYSLCTAHCRRCSVLAAPSPEHVGFNICGFRWACSSWCRLCLSAFSVRALPLLAPGSQAEKCVDRRQRLAGLMLWSLLFQSQVHTALPYMCDHHVTSVMDFPFFLSSHQQDFDLLP